MKFLSLMLKSVPSAARAAVLPALLAVFLCVPAAWAQVNYVIASGGGGTDLTLNALQGRIGGTLVNGDSITFNNGDATLTTEFTLGTGATLTFKGFNSGAGVSGGAVYVFNDLTGGITRSTFTSNTSAWNGGAVFVFHNLSGGITESSFTGNTVTNGPGGAVYVFNDLTGGITGSTFTGNTATNDSGGAVNVFNLSGGISGSIFSGNTAGGDGGALFVLGDLVGGIMDSTFTSNTAEGGDGGAVSVDSDLAGGIMDSTFSGNTAARCLC